MFHFPIGLEFIFIITFKICLFVKLAIIIIYIIHIYKLGFGVSNEILRFEFQLLFSKSA